VKKVYASRGKYIRAEPVSTLYSEGRVAHVGTFPELERQMCDFAADGLSQGRSPDRLDALVWAITDLMLADHRKPGVRALW
jgi:phage terminase large subunit-like protein